MARGPKPQPAEVKRAKGNPGKRKIVEVAPTPAVDTRTVAPPELDAPAKAVWDAVAPDLARANIIRDTDRFALARYCEHLASWWKLTAEIKVEGITYQSSSPHGTYMRVNPKVMARDRIEREMVVLEGSFGLTPAARQQIMYRLAQAPAQVPTGTLFDKADSVSDPGQPVPPAASPIGFLSRTTNVH